MKWAIRFTRLSTLCLPWTRRSVARLVYLEHFVNKYVKRNVFLTLPRLVVQTSSRNYHKYLLLSCEIRGIEIRDLCAYIESELPGTRQVFSSL